MTIDKRFTRWRKRYYPFLWFVAAADEDKLLQCPVAEQDKQAGIGLAIICTAIAAILSGYFAFNTILSSWWRALLVASFWGLLILNLDRVMVSSMRKDSQGQWWNELLVASPRILLALLISVLITKPIEVEFFRNQINTRKNSVIELALDEEMNKQDSVFKALSAERADSKKEQYNLEKTVNDCGGDGGWVQANGETLKCKKEYQDYENKIQGSLKMRSALYNNDHYSERNADDGKRHLNIAGHNVWLRLSREIKDLQERQVKLDCAFKQQKADDICNNYRTRQGVKLQKTINEADRRNDVWVSMDSLNKHIRDSIKTSMRHAYDDIFGQLRILKVLKKDDNAMRQASWLIIMLFFTLETAPLLVKILSGRGKYDMLLRVAEEEARNQEDHSIKMAEENKRIQLDAARQSKDNLLQKEKEAADKIIEQSLQANSELGTAIIQKWQQNEMKKLNDNPDDYLNNVITSNT